MSSMKQIVLATRNQGKIAEIKAIFPDDIEFLSYDDFERLPEVVEDGRTFEENAIKKAIEVARWTGRVALADDSGLEVDVLGRMPGVLSARFAGPGASDEANNVKLLDLMRGVPDGRRGARFRCVIAVATPGGDVKTAQGVCEGYIAHEMRGARGFGYDPLFVVPEYGKTFAELGPEIKNKISHRAKALEKARGILDEVLAGRGPIED